MPGVGRLSMLIRHLAYLVIAVVAGCGLTLVFYMVGAPFVLSALYLARLFAEDRGGDSLLGPFLVANTALCAALVYATLCLIGRAVKAAGD